MLDILRIVNRTTDIIESYSFEGNKETQSNISALADFSVAEAQQNLLNYVEKNLKGNSWHFVTLFLKLFPELSQATYGLISRPNANWFEWKLVAIVDDRVYDLTSSIKQKGTNHSLILCVKYCNIPIDDYCNKLQEGEKLTILPNPKDFADMPFKDYICSNLEESN